MKNRTSLESTLVDCRLRLVGRAEDNVLDLRDVGTYVGVPPEFNILFPTPESALNKKEVDWPPAIVHQAWKPIPKAIAKQGRIDEARSRWTNPNL